MSEEGLNTSDEIVGTSSETEDFDQNFQKKISENVKLHPHPPKVRNTDKNIAVLEPKKPHCKKSKYIGVFWNSTHEKWQMRTKFKNRVWGSTYYHTEEEAARHYDKFAKEVVKKYSKQNFAEEGELVTSAIEDKISADRVEGKGANPELADVFGPSTILDIEAARKRALEEEDGGDQS